MLSSSKYRGKDINFINHDIHSSVCWFAIYKFSYLVIRYNSNHDLQSWGAIPRSHWQLHLQTQRGTPRYVLSWQTQQGEIQGHSKASYRESPHPSKNHHFQQGSLHRFAALDNEVERIKGKVCSEAYPNPIKLRDPTLPKGLSRAQRQDHRI